MTPRWNPNPDVRTGRHVTYSLHVHLALSLGTGVVRQIMREVCVDFEAALRELIANRIMCTQLVHYPPKVQLSKVVDCIKGVSARELRKEFDSHVCRYLGGGHSWSGSLRRQLRRSATHRRRPIHRNRATPLMSRPEGCASPPP